MDVRVVAVVTTWNRLLLLEECLAALAGQTHRPAVAVVVDNACTDGTPQRLDALARRHADLDVVHLSTNVGGAGGFAVGIERALTHAPDLLWLLDDDTVPTKTAADELVGAWLAYSEAARGRPRGRSTARRPAVLASKVVWTDGRDHPMNTPRAKPDALPGERRAAARVGCVPIRSASFVSVMCDAGVVARRGVPVADYFVWNDDFEYTTRLLRGNRGLYCPASVVVHKTGTFGAIDADPGERFFHEVRNKVWTFTRSNGLNPAEKALYAGSTARRWLRTLRGATDRATLRRGLVRGLREGLLTSPRPNAEVLSPAVPGGGEAGPAERQPFSLLMAVYAGDDPAHLREAFASTVVDQERRPSQVVLVQDGPVPEDLAGTIADLAATSPVQVDLVALPGNRGLGPALDAGLAACTHEIVARMDADDVSDRERFLRQVPLIEAGADIVGTGLLEFGVDVTDVVGRRTPPTDPAEIRRTVAFRDPFNHPTVVYRKSAVRAAGGYQELALMEDYLLFARMLAGGARPANLSEPLVYYRVGAGAYSRRGGRLLLASELALQRRFRSEGITTRGQFVRNVVVRGGYRLVPEAVRRTAYRALIANRGNRGPARTGSHTADV